MRLVTLQNYVLREMGKTFCLTTIGLTGILSTCGGVFTVIPLEAITATQMLLLLALVIPTAAAFTLPIAALFSATMTYGRMAADNEFIAVRSSGINTYRLFLPCVLLSVLSAAVTFMLFNFVIPALTNQIRDLSQLSLKAIMTQALANGRDIEFRNFRVYADEFRDFALSVAEGQEIDALWMSGVAFIEFEGGTGEEAAGAAGSGDTGDRIIRFGTGESAVIKFDARAQNPQVEADLANIVVFDLERNIVPRLVHQQVGPYEFLKGFRSKPRHLSLPRLLESRKRPEEVFSKVSKRLTATRRIILAKLLFEDLQQCLAEGCRLPAEDGEVLLRARDPELGIERGRSRFWLQMSDVVVEDRTADGTEIIRSDSGRVEIQQLSDHEPGILIDLAGHVRMTESAAPDAEVRLPARQMRPLQIPQDLLQRFRSAEFASDRLLDRKVKYDLGPQVEASRKKLIRERTRMVHKIHAELHSRTVYSLSVLVVAVLGAALGIIYRGGQVLVAFGISFVPTLFVILMTITGKTLAKGQHTLEVGVAVMWAGLAVVLVIDFLVFKKYLPR